MKTKLIKLKACRGKKGCSYTSFEDMTGKTFETPVKKAA